MTNAVEHLLICLLGICISSGEMYVHILCLFFNWIIVFLLLSCKNSLYKSVLVDLEPSYGHQWLRFTVIQRSSHGL